MLVLLCMMAAYVTLVAHRFFYNTVSLKITANTYPSLSLYNYYLKLYFYLYYFKPHNLYQNMLQNKLNFFYIE